MHNRYAMPQNKEEEEDIKNGCYDPGPLPSFPRKIQFIHLNKYFLFALNLMNGTSMQQI